MSAARILGALLPVLLLLFLAGAGVWWAIRREPSSSRPEPAGDLAWWALLSAEEQEAYDAEVIEATAAAEDEARAAAEHLAQRVQVNALFHP